MTKYFSKLLVSIILFIFSFFLSNGYFVNFFRQFRGGKFCCYHIMERMHQPKLFSATCKYIVTVSASSYQSYHQKQQQGKYCIHVKSARKHFKFIARSDCLSDLSNVEYWINNWGKFRKFWIRIWSGYPDLISKIWIINFINLLINFLRARVIVLFAKYSSVNIIIYI